MSPIINTPDTPYVAVIFTSIMPQFDKGYAVLNRQLELILTQQPGFLGLESARAADVGITVSYWDDYAAVLRWKRQELHVEAQEKGRALWYKAYKIRICRVEREYGFEK